MKISDKNTIMVITDYNFLPKNIEEFWFLKYTENFLVYDKAHRFIETDRIKHQKNTGANIYDIFHFIYTNYYDLPNISIFCKGNVIPRHCGPEKFDLIINNQTFTSIENYIRETPKFQLNAYSFVTENDEYWESINEVNYTVSQIHKSKFIFSYKNLLEFIFENPTVESYIRFAPGGNYIIPKENILKYNRFFYETMLDLVSWDHKPGEAYLLERAMYTIFDNNFTIKKIFTNFY